MIGLLQKGYGIPKSFAQVMAPLDFHGITSFKISSRVDAAMISLKEGYYKVENG